MRRSRTVLVESDRRGGNMQPQGRLLDVLIPTKRETVKKTLSLLAVVLVVLTVVPAFQNWQPVDVRFFFWTLQVNMFLLILLSWLLGAVTARPLYRGLKSWLKARGKKTVTSGETRGSASSAPHP